MHELSLVQSIFATLKDELSLEEYAQIDSVDLQIGKLSNVEPLLLQNAFTAFQETHPEHAGISLNTEIIEIRIHCPNCGINSEVKNYIFKCKQCGQPSREIVSGEELNIQRIHFRET